MPCLNPFSGCLSSLRRFEQLGSKAVDYGVCADRNCTSKMNEYSALEIIAVRSIEAQDRERAVWTDVDRAWASRTAAGVVGEKANAETFLARRASLALERFGERNHLFLASVRGMHWQPWYGWVVIAIAFVFGFVIDRIGGSHRVDLLAPPVLALIGWNLAIYFILLTTPLFRQRQPTRLGLLRRGAMRTVEFATSPNFSRSKYHVAGNNVAVASLVNITNTWLVSAKSLYAARIGRILHTAAAALAFGVILGLYVRGIAFEYKATWESTFLDATAIHALLAAILAPGAWLTGIAIPSTAHIQSIQAPSSENAAAWLHLYAASVFLIVLLPRIALASSATYEERKVTSNFPISIEGAYFQHLLRSFHAGPERVRVIPFSYTLPEPVQAGLESVVTRTFGGSASLILEPSVLLDDDGGAVGRMAKEGRGPVIALFNLTATPEDEVHGAFIKALKGHFEAGHNLIAVVDESAFLARWPDDEIRLQTRRRAWSDWLASQRMGVIHANLADPDLESAEMAINEMLYTHEMHNQAIT